MNMSAGVGRLWDRIVTVAVLGCVVAGGACFGNAAEQRAVKENEAFRETMREVARLPRYAHSDEKIVRY